MKITYFITSLNFGGAEVGMSRLISEINDSDIDNKFDITVVSLAKTTRDVVDLLPASVTVHHLDLKSPYQLWKTLPLLNELHDTDVLVCSLYHASVFGVLLGTLYRVPQIMTWQHNSEYRSATAQRLYRLCYRFSDNVLADSEAVKKMLISKFNLPHSKVSVLPIAGIDTEVFSPKIDSAEFSNDCLVQIGTIGRLTQQKGYDYLLKCADQIEDAHFHIIGEGKLENEIQTTIDRLELKNVTLHGNVSHESLPKLMSQFDIYFQPSRYEGLCMTVIEAMSSGLPIVASETGGIKESVINGETGYLVSPGAIEEYTDRLQELIDDPDKCRQFGQFGRERVKNRYSKEVFRDLFLELIN